MNRICPEIKEGMKITLFVNQTADNVTRSLALASVVEELPDNENIIIQTPMRQGYFFSLPREPIILRFIVESALYSLRVQFEERIERENFTYARMNRLSQIARHQMREHFRLECLLPVVITRKIKEKNQTVSHTGEGFALDISEGGMLMSTDEDIRMNEIITVTFDIGRKETLESLVLRVTEDPQAEHRYTVGLKFIHQYKSQPDRIYKYIIRMQVERM